MADHSYVDLGTLVHPNAAGLSEDETTTLRVVHISGAVECVCVCVCVCLSVCLSVSACIRLRINALALLIF